MKKFLLGGFIVWGVASLNTLIFAESELHQAINHANEGNITLAIQELEVLSRNAPNDPKIALSLGLLYQQANRDDEAILQLEKSIGLRPKPQALFALGMLYEGKLFATQDKFWREKAIRSWEGFLQITPPDHPHRSVAQRHLLNLQNNG